MNESHLGYAPNYCPNCGCSIKNIAVALQFSALKASGGLNGNGSNGHAERATRREPRETKPWTDDDVVKAYRMKKEGSTNPEVAAALDRSLSSVNAAMYSPSLKRRARELKDRIDAESAPVNGAAAMEHVLPQLKRPIISAAEIAQAKELAEQGKKAPEIAGIMKISVSRVYAALRLDRDGVRNRTGIRTDALPVSAYEMKRLSQLREEGKTMVEISDLMGTSEERLKTIHRAMRRQKGGR